MSESVRWFDQYCVMFMSKGVKKVLFFHCQIFFQLLLAKRFEVVHNALLSAMRHGKNISRINELADIHRVYLPLQASSSIVVLACFRFDFWIISS
ncbi:hypothetical protein Phpb_04330 [Photorhabdus namnaonensis]|uniref:Uncharacterized protein n=1 Tax=Photorhabdus namnaonensis TaxID=1851568 RepID=A0A1B8YBF9_9GAMM|nr:hypothetical protein Phpb_04330 [Photorhabdus namnaonensis]